MNWRIGMIGMWSAALLSSCNGCQNETQTEVHSPSSLPAICSKDHQSIGNFTPPAGLEQTDIKVGEGAVANEGMFVHVHYVGTLKDGTIFDESCKRGVFSFGLGEGRVIAGWDQGVVGMRVGGIRRLLIPAHLAYGTREIANIIPANSSLAFDIELVEADGE